MRLFETSSITIISSLRFCCAINEGQNWGKECSHRLTSVTGASYVGTLDMLVSLRFARWKTSIIHTLKGRFVPKRLELP